VIVDTGAEQSTLPDHSVSAALSHASWGPAVTFFVGGTSVTTVVANGIECKADVQNHGGGAASTETTSIGIAIHWIAAGTAPFVNFDGLLGIDLLDAFKADPVKDRALTTSYLARRV
jgi:hypothetical protein